MDEEKVNGQTSGSDMTADEAVAVSDGDPHAEKTVWDEGTREAAEVLRAVYPEFDLESEMEDPMFRAMVAGEIKPTLRQVYEACRFGALMEDAISRATEAAVSEAVSAAVATATAESAEAVADAVAETEARLIRHIQARGQRPAENGTRGAAGVRMHPAVGRLTRRDRAQLAKRAERGETIRL